MVKRMKSLATFGAGPYATGDITSRLGHYNYNNFPNLKSIFLAVFDNKTGPCLRYQTPTNVVSTEIFKQNSGLIIPKPQLFCRSIKICLKKNDYKILGYPIGLDHPSYDRGRFSFNMCFVVSWDSESDIMYEPIVQKCAEYLIELEQDYWFLSNSKYENDVYQLIDEMYNNLVTKGENVSKIISRSIQAENNSTADEECVDVSKEKSLENDTQKLIMMLYFKLCPSYRGIEPPEVSIYMVPMFIRDIKLTNRLIEGMDVLSQKIIPQIDGIKTVKEIANAVELDSALVARCVRNLHFYECVSLVPMFLYSNNYVATERVHDFYMDKSEIMDCLEFVKIQSDEDDDMPNPEFSDVFRLYLSLKCGIKLSDWVSLENPRSMGIDEHRLVQFGMHHQFLRKLTVYPICTIPTNGEKFLSACNGKTSLEELALDNNLEPGVLYNWLDESKKFEFVMK